MSVTTFFDETVVIRRQRDIAGTNKSAVQATATADCHIQKLDGEARQLIGAATEDVYMAWFAIDSPIAEGDQITDGDGKLYLVKEIAEADYGINQHKEVILIKHN